MGATVNPFSIGVAADVAACPWEMASPYASCCGSC